MKTAQCRSALLVTLSLAFGLSQLSAVQPSTSLRIVVRGPDGEPAPVRRADILLVAWGVTESEPATVEGNVVHLDLNPSAPPEWAAGFGDFRAYLYVEADGYAPILSEAFDWTVIARIGFRKGQAVTVDMGKTATLHVRLRRPALRRVRLVDSVGSPVPGIEIRASRYWSSANHCGQPTGCGFRTGSALLVAGKTDDDGWWFEIPDGDFQYLLTVSGRLRFTTPRASEFPQQLVAFLETPDSVLHVQRYRRQAMDLRVLQDGKPLRDALLYGEVVACPCGACFGSMAATNAAGRLTIEEFYPEEWSALWLCASGREGWRSPEGGVRGGRIAVDIANDIARSKPDPAELNRCRP